jgi:preprotein translocase subunit SecA
MVAIAFARPARLPFLQARRSCPLDAALLRDVREREAMLLAAHDADLRIAIEQLRDRVAGGASPAEGSVLAPALALTAEAVRRTLAQRVYDVQILAGAVLARGAIAEMQTGEGKTLTALFPAVVHGLRGRGVHVVTANAYLAARDCERVRPVFELLGLSCRLLPERAPSAEKQAAYGADVTYGPGHEFGFDFLRDQVAARPAERSPLGHDFLQTLKAGAPRESRLQRGLAFAIIDEADNVLLDDAVSPLVLSGAAGADAPDAAVHHQARRLALSLEPADDYRVDPSAANLELTPAGASRIHDAVEVSTVSQLRRPWSEYVLQALRAELLMRRDVHYVVEDGTVRIVDGSTGRIFADRTWQDGLHQAIEAKERLRIREEQQPLARVTRQRFFRMYDGLCGLTGTAAGSEAEFREVYGVDVIPIPLRTPSRRLVHPTRAFVDRLTKQRAALAEIERRNRRGQPVLVGTRSIRDSEELSAELADAGVRHQLLNGRQDAEEAAIIAAAGELGAVTIATNLAGRGTDIRPSPAALERGGLFVLAAERHESQRVDRQLIGRCARQGDPGEAQSFVAADDSLLRSEGEWLASAIWRSADSAGAARLDIDRGVGRIQQRLERDRARQRKALLRLDAQRNDLTAQFVGAEQ